MDRQINKMFQHLKILTVGLTVAAIIATMMFGWMALAASYPLVFLGAFFAIAFFYFSYGFGKVIVDDIAIWQREKRAEEALKRLCEKEKENE